MGIYTGRRSSCLNRWPPNWKLKLKNWPRIKARSADAILEMARRLVATTDESLFGDTEFALRDRAQGIVADAYASHLPQKRDTPLPQSTAPTAPDAPPSTAIAKKRSKRSAGRSRATAPTTTADSRQRLLPLGPSGRIDHAPPLTSRRATRHALRSGRRQLREGHRTAPGNGRRSVERIDRRAAPRKRPGSGSPNTCRRGAPSVAKNRGNGSVTPADALWATSSSTRPAYGNRDRAVKRPRVEWPTSE